MAFELPFPPFPHDSRDVPFIATPDDNNGYAVPSSQYFKKLVGDKNVWVPVSADDPLPTSDATIQTRIGEVQAAPTANTLLARLKNLETKVDAIIADGLQLSGSNMDLRGTAATKPLATAVPIGATYWSVDTDPSAEAIEVSDGTNWVVM